MTVSLWRQSGPREHTRCEILVVGAGIAGLSAGGALAERRIDALVIDRGGIGAGASSRNAGFLMRGAAENYALCVRELGRERAHELWTLTEDNLTSLRRLGIEELPTYSRRASCLLALEPVEQAELEESHSLLKEDGFAVEWYDENSNPRDTVWSRAKPRCGLVNPNDAVCNPYDVLKLLSNRLARPIIEHQELFHVERRNGELLVRTTNLDIECRRALLCLNAFLPLLIPDFADSITPRRGQMFAMRANGRKLAHAYYANRGSEYFRQVTDDVIICGGCRTYFADRELGYDDKTTDYVQSRLEQFAAQMFGEPIEIITRWAGTMGFSSDALPVIGTVDGGRDWGDLVWVCGGFTGHGMSMGHQVARHAVGCMLGQEENRFPLGRLRRNASKTA